MTPEHWKRVKQLFHAALERDPAERGAFLDQACQGDSLLRQQVQDLLTSDDNTVDILDQPMVGMAAELMAGRPSPFAPGRTVGPFQVIKEIGRGGMGEVYLARDTRLDRPVAIKVLPDSLASSAERVRRFQQEARTASSLNHPNIVTIHEVSEFEGFRLI